MRTVLNLCGLYKFIKYVRSCMVTLLAILPVLCQNDWFIALDLQDTYFLVVILLIHKKFLCFVVGESHFQYTDLPYSAPHVFTKCMTVVMADLRKKGLHIFLYLNDWLPKGSSGEEVLAHIDIMLSLLDCQHSF